MASTGNISRYLRVSAYCFLCNRPFSTDHAPVAIRACGHIFGYRCLSITLNGGDVDVKATWSDVSMLAPKGAKCPECKVPITHIESEQKALSILRDISSDAPDQRNRLHAFVEQLRESVAKEDPDVEPKDYMQFFRRCYTSDGDDILQKALQDAASAGDYFSPFHDAITASRASDPQPMGFALLRLCYLLWDAHHAMRRKSSVSINVLLWEGNRCLGVTNPLVQWEDVEEAAEMEDTRLFPLLHCFTMLASQALARQNLSSIITSRAADSPAVEERLTEAQLIDFRMNCLGYIPFMHLPESTTPDDLQADYPLLCLAIRTACTKALTRQMKMSSQLRETLASKIVAHGERSMDLLFCVIMCIGWSKYFAHRKQFLGSTCGLARTLISDLRLDKPKEPSGCPSLGPYDKGTEE
ncbi:hypothetical protein PtrEW7m1_011417, partial [Pyrenophora tritici-repentis]